MTRFYTLSGTDDGPFWNLQLVRSLKRTGNKVQAYFGVNDTLTHEFPTEHDAQLAIAAMANGANSPVAVNTSAEVSE
jgi:hypothetical protein